MTYETLPTVVHGEPIEVDWGNQVRANLEALPRGVLGLASTTVTHSGIGSSITDINNLSVQVEVAAGRLIRITGHAQFIQRDALGSTTGWIREGSTQLNRFGIYSDQPLNASRMFDGSAVVVSPSAGLHTYKLSAQTSAGSLEIGAAAGRPSFILVEDIGPA